MINPGDRPNEWVVYCDKPECDYSELVTAPTWAAALLLIQARGWGVAKLNKDLIRVCPICAGNMVEEDDL